MCLYPKLIKNRKYTANKKNGGNIPAIVDDRVKFVPIGCQNCIECRKQKSREWQSRLLEDIKHNRNGKFITLTFTDESIKQLTDKIQEKSNPTGYDLDNEIATLGTRLFLERWRKKYKKSLRHWLVTELGHNGTENIHLHGIIWTDESMDEVERIWSYGFMWKGKKERGRLTNYVNDKTVGYITKYVTKIDEKHTRYKSKILTSPGIGNGYTKNSIGDWNNNKYKENGETIETFRTRTGHKIGLPIYWRNKIYSEEEREKLWLKKLDKEVRYVCGQKVSIRNGFQEYDALVRFHRQRNKELGFGDDTRNFDKEQYERDRRILLQKTRIAKAINKKNKSKILTGPELGNDAGSLSRPPLFPSGAGEHTSMRRN